MESRLAKTVTAVIIVVAAFVLGFFVVALLQQKKSPEPAPVAKVETKNPTRVVIGKSVEGRDIEAYTYGGGETSARKKLLFVGGIHGGYEWNSVLVAYNIMDYLNANQSALPADLEVTVIPDLNPDGVYKIIGKEGRFTLADVPQNIDQKPGRFNAHHVDLNRNFDCNWQPKGIWQGRMVSAGGMPFSEPEARAFRDYILTHHFDAVVMYHSAAGGVYASQCKNGILPATTQLMNTYARSSGYPAVPVFTAYAVGGASEDWLALQHIPAITVELRSHNDVEWEQNLRGVEAVLQTYK